MGPIAGQDYEIVEYEIVEEGPERTVSISTWREQAIQEADSDDAMSVYYVTADDCIHADATEIDVATEFVPPPRKAAETANVASGSGSNNSGDKSKSSGKTRSSRRREASDFVGLRCRTLLISQNKNRTNREKDPTVRPTRAHRRRIRSPQVPALGHRHRVVVVR